MNILGNFFKRKEKMAMFNPETQIPMTEEERARHEESEGRRQQVEHEEAMRSAEKGIKESGMTPTVEEMEEAERKAGERESTRPWGE